MELRYRTVETARGYVGFVASRRGLRRVYLPFRNAGSLKRAISADAPGAIKDPSLMPDFVDDLERYFAGEAVEFAVPLDWTGWTTFEVDVWEACRRIGYGRTRSYKQLAEYMGRPGGARAIGTAMSRTPCPIVVPCHRVVKSDGALGGFSAPGGATLKRRLLEMEATSQVV
ncbi:MAG: methylated-DNA--[protein]-cysteine S-methyltransferase [Phycisphaerae bacterium]